MNQIRLRARRSPFPRSVSRCLAAWCAGGLLAAGAAAASTAPPSDEPDAADLQTLRATHMTFVGSRGESSELVLKSRFATFVPDIDRADLTDVHAVFTDDDGGDSFEMTCDEAELDVETNDFRAEGNVRGTTSAGQRYSTTWVEYDHEAGELRSDAPVVMIDGNRTYSGIGFVYQVEDRTFRLLRNVSVVQTP